MRLRFKKVWCDACKSMQFAGECPHGRVVNFAPVAGRLNFSGQLRMTENDSNGRLWFSGVLSTEPARRR